MRYLSEAGFDAVPLRELAAMLKSKTDLPSKTVVLTFDDGFRNFYSDAFPVLSEYDFRATVFLVTDFCNKRNDWSGNPPDLPRSKLLSWDEVRELNTYGIEFGSHTKTHPDLTKLTAAEIGVEVVESKAAIEDALGRETTTFAYPFGRHDAAIRQIAVANFEAACSTDLGKVTPRSDFSLLNRIDSYYLSNQRLFEMIESAIFENYMSFRQVMRNVKSLLNPV
ncbi:MAG: polysaccharide deacetylase family protein [Acidobacteria bacterium]|nr:polysaccharide deacetylase family protein [Acidobacteriota bacterium]